MSDTANINIYRIRNDVDLNQIIIILNNCGYIPVKFNEDIQQRQSVEITAFKKLNNIIPDWVNMVEPYLESRPQFTKFQRYDFIAFMKYISTSGQPHLFVICAGSGYYHIADYIDKQFGITILEYIFDPNTNRISSVGEKGIIGDILASRRFYRRARPVTYEDDFGKYYQSISVRFENAQVKNNFPNLSNYKGNKLKPKISISGSSSVNIQMKLNLFALIMLLKDIAELMTNQAPAIFNKNLVPLDIRTDKELIKKLNETTLENIVNFFLDPVNVVIDFDFCHREFENFFRSNKCQLSFHNLFTKKGEKLQIEFEDVCDVSNPTNFLIIFRKIKETTEYHQTNDCKSFLIDTLKNIHVITTDDEGKITTEGKLIEYIQQEIEIDNISYFLLDDNWYRLQNRFDIALAEHYRKRISSRLKVYKFIHKWNNKDETEYNKLYTQHTIEQPYSFYFHQIKVGQIELCDALIINHDIKTIYILHVKDGIGATIRDLTAQAVISARIIEEESHTETKDSLIKLYKHGVKNHRINAQIISQQEFIQWISSYNREYTLVIHNSNKTILEIETGDFDSRIAKHALVEFASAMHVYDWEFSICCI